MKFRKILALSALVVLALGGLFAKHWLVPYDLDEERAKARAAGLPLSAAEFARTIPPAADDAAPEYNALVSLLKRKPANDKAFEPSTATVPALQTAALKAYLRSRPDIARLVHAAAARPHAYFPHKWTTDELLPYLAQMRSAAIWLRRESLVLAREGRFEEAVANQALGFRVPQHAGEDPIIISFLVSLACDNITLSGMADIMREAGPNEKVDIAVRNAILAYHPTRDFARCWKGEAVFGLTTIHDTTDPSSLSALGNGRSGAQSKALPRRVKGQRLWIWDANEALYLHWMTLGLKAAEQPEAIRAEAVGRAADEFDHSLWMRQPATLLTMILYPMFSRALASAETRLAQRSVVTAAASVMLFRAQHGRFPSTLEEAAAPAPTDPRTGKALGYRLEGKGCAVYSVGKTLRFTASPGQPTKNESFFSYP